MVERRGNTKVSSVSISPEFWDLMQEFHISPSKAITKGIAVELMEKGVKQYNSPLNKERKKFIDQFLEDMQKDKRKEAMYQSFLAFAESIIKAEEIIKKNEP